MWTSSDERWPKSVAEMIDTTRRLRDVRRVAVMPDVHLSQGFCVVTVLATDQLIYPSAVGGDIGCGMLALAFNTSADALHPKLAQMLLKLLPKLVPANRHPGAVHVALANRPRLSHARLDRVMQRDGKIQLGTLGRGNHFLELQRDLANDRLWLMIHSGSRGLGQTISAHHQQHPTGHSHGRAYLDALTSVGRAYLHDLAIARAYARLNRIRMARAVCFVLHELARITTDPTSVIHTDHNHVRFERLDDQCFWVHRKGAAPAFTGLPSVIPGSMGTASFHVVGLGMNDALQSSSHGAGRIIDRTTARHRITPQNLTQQMRGVYFNVNAVSRLTDEAPTAYKDIEHIIRLQRGQVKILRRLMPLLSYKGGS